MTGTETKLRRLGTHFHGDDVGPVAALPPVRGKRLCALLLVARIEFICEFPLQLAKPGRAPEEVVRALASRDQWEAAGSPLSEREDVVAEDAIDLLGGGSGGA